MNKKIRKWIMILLSGIAGLLLLLFFLIQLPAVQNKVKDLILENLSQKYGSRLSIGHIDIRFFDRITAEDILFLDQQGDTLLAADHLRAEIGIFNLFSRTIAIDEAHMEGLFINIYQTGDSTFNFSFLLPGQDSVSKTPSAPWNFSFTMLNLEKPRIIFEDNSMHLSVRPENLLLDMKEVDLEDKRLIAETLNISGLTADVNIKASEGEPEKSEFYLSPTAWVIELNETQLTGREINIRSAGNHERLSELQIQLNNSVLRDSTFSTRLESFTSAIHNRSNIQELSSDIKVMGSEITLADFVLRADENHAAAEQIIYNFNSGTIRTNSLNAELSHEFMESFRNIIPPTIQLLNGRKLSLRSQSLKMSPSDISGTDVFISYGNALDLRGSFAFSGINSPNMQIDANIIGLSSNPVLLDKMLVNFDLPDSLRNFQRLNIRGQINGTMQHLRLNDFELRLDNAIAGHMSGELMNLNDPQSMVYDFHVHNFEGNIKNLHLRKIEGLALDSLGQLAIRDTRISGGNNRMNIIGQINSELGSFFADLSLQIPSGNEVLTYKGELKLDSFDLGTLTGNPDLARLSLSTRIDGRGTDIANLASGLEGKIDLIEYKGYKYRDIVINAEISESRLTGQLEIDDDNIRLNYNGTIDFGPESYLLDFTANIDTIALFPLGLSPYRVGMGAEIHSGFKLPLSPGEEGEIMIRNLKINNTKNIFREDSIRLLAHRSADSTFINMESGFLEMSAAGVYSILELPKAFGNIIRHYDLQPSATPKELNSKSMKLRVFVRTIAPVNMLFPGTLLQMARGEADLDVDFGASTISGQLVADSFYLSNYFTEHLTITLKDSTDALAVNIKGSNNRIGNIEIPILRLDNLLNDEEFKSIFIARDEDAIPRLKFSTTTRLRDRAFAISFNDSLILNQKDWTINSDNLILIDSSGAIAIHNFTMTDQNEFLNLSTSGPDNNNLIVNFENFNVSQFPTLLTSEPSKLEGAINGEITVKDLKTDRYFLLDLSISQITYEGSRVGEFMIHAEDAPSTDIITANFKLKGPQNDLTGTGTYNITSEALDFDIGIESFQLKLLDPFLSEIIRNSEGVVEGHAKLSGSFSQPNIEGKVILDGVVTTIVANNARYSMDSHEVSFDNNSIDIGNLDIYDENNNLAMITGKIHHDHLSDFVLDLELDTEAFTFLNTTAADNPIFYGKIILNANVYIGGSPDLMYVDAVAETLEGTNITISPFAETGMILKEEFITYGKPGDYADITSKYLLQLARRYPFDANILLDATNEAYMTFVVDPIRGDRIEGFGTGNLRIKLNPTGEQQFFGRYYVTQGSYSFSYSDIINKEFEIQPGGSVTFSGNPLEARLDIDAIYSVYTSTYELIRNEVTLTDSEISAAQSRTTVNVLLSLTGSLQSPEIKLDIKVPRLQSGSLVSTLDRKLSELRNDPNALNNQVFGLLVFNSFLATDNATAGLNNFGDDIALSSISSLLSNQLNNLANHLIKGVDINIDVNSYDSRYVNEGAGGNITEVGLEVSKQLFDDRLSVTAGTNFNVNNQPTVGQYSSFIGDFMLEYKLTKSGDYRLRMFSRTEFDRLLYENANKTGISFFFRKPFDSKTDGK